MVTPAIFGPDKETRLDAVRDLLNQAEASLAGMKQERRRALDGVPDDHDSRELTLETEIAALKAEENQLEDLQEFSEGFDKKVRPFLAIATEIVKIMPGPAAEAIAPVIDGLLETFEKLDGTHLRYRKLIARQRRNAYQAYIDAGFTEAQAMRLVESEASVSSPIDTLRNNAKIDLKS